eukprot:756141-Hanusia_phi.AAC.5
MQVIACGVTPHPPNAKVLKTALRSADYVEIEHEDSTLSAVRKLRCQNYSLYALETTSHSQVYTLVNFSKPCALVVGNELLGISPEVSYRLALHTISPSRSPSTHNHRDRLTGLPHPGLAGMPPTDRDPHVRIQGLPHWSHDFHWADSQDRRTP